MSQADGEVASGWQPADVDEFWKSSVFLIYYLKKEKKKKVYLIFW